MNTYEVRGKTENGTNLNRKCTEANEAAARKAFRSVYREAGCKVTIDSVELVAENQLATKQQEREALASIRQIVEALGPQSYLATAFEGCFEDAENNIEDDAAYSMKARYDDATRRALDKEFGLAEANKEIERMRSQQDELFAQIKQMETRLLSADDLTDCASLAGDRAYEHETKMNEAASRIVELASQPESPEFQQAVGEHRNAKSSLEYCKALQERLNQNIRAGA